ncbi:winged helix-turn-helix domain-containing protein [Thalassovita taeanensis]|uniref:winged helix-turn-helix domain-containing protein n=1 Tax=Thalassovita taeanensis TaxID=657014 RepID=UPI000A6C52B7
MATPTLSNARARRLFLQTHGLSGLPPGPGKGADLAGVIAHLGFVQLDSINTVARAHDLILFARRPSYRPRNLELLLDRDRAIFEHWTHDASVIPMQFYPHWKLKFARDADRLRDRWKAWQRHGFEGKFDEILTRIRDTGPLCSSDVGTDEVKKGDGWWDWHPSKTALEFLWRRGDLAVARRVAFQKHYDLSTRVIAPDMLVHLPDPQDTINWACAEALSRLGFATSGELAAFWDLVTPAEARAWCASEQASGKLIEVDITSADGSLRRSFARPDIFDQAATAADPTGRIRVLSPFDPALRDRKRAERLFGFFYRIEVFTPAAKRQYGYYVFPLLEGDRLIGRIDMKSHRAEGTLRVTALWPEPGVRFGKGRLTRLEAELDRVARFSGCDRVEFADGWLRETQP